MSPDVMTGGELRRRLGWGKDRFYAAVRSGRFRHLVSIHASSTDRLVYVRTKVEAYIAETPAALPSRLQASPDRKAR